MSGAANALLVNADHITIISHNIANVSTAGYKSRKPVFFDKFARSYHSKNTIGSGVGISSIIQNFNDGTFMNTGRELDLSISKTGFFRVLDSKGHVYYTRNGQFSLDKHHNIITMQGLYLTGQNKSNINHSVNDVSNIEVMNLKNAQILQAKPTSKIVFKNILHSNSNIIKETDNSKIVKNPLEETHTTYVNIYKKNGEEEKLNVSFKKLLPHQWELTLKSDQSDSNPNKNGIDTTIALAFNEDGVLLSNGKIFIGLQNSTEYEGLHLDFDGIVEKDNIDESYTQEIIQNGHAQGELETFNISSNGEMVGEYSNDRQEVIGKILLSKFINADKLQVENGNMWSATEESGTEQIGTPGNNGFGVVSNKNLEQSNVNLNEELINMIVAQRNYQSNAQVFHTEEKIINTLINLR